jgi:KaiC/GvpD/RAD55 family RecA-like ATPase
MHRTSEIITAQPRCHGSIILAPHDARARENQRPVTMNCSTHLVHVFADDEPLIAAVARFISEGLRAGDTCLVCATPGHREQLAELLRAAGLDPEALEAEYRYITLDAERTLASFYEPRTGINRMRFHRNVDQLLRQASARGQPVRIFGEMVTLLLDRNRPECAIELEELWNEASRQHNFCLLCTYPNSEFTRNPRYRQLLHAVHSHAVFEDA